MIEVTTASLGAHPFLYGMPDDLLARLAGTATIARFPARHRIFEEGRIATRFWLIRSGYVALDLEVPGEGRVVVETIRMGDALGWSWLFPPYQWAFGAVAVDPVEAFEFDGPAVRALCREDPRLGYELTWRLAEAIASRLKATRMRLLAQYRTVDAVAGE